MTAMTPQATRLLLVEDDAAFVKLLRASLKKMSGGAPFEITGAATLEEALENLESDEFDIILTDLNLPDSKGLDTLNRLLDVAEELPVVVLSAQDESAVEMEAIHSGAQDYLVKGETDYNVVVRSIRYAIERKHIESELKRTRERYRSIYENTLEGIFQTTLEGKYLTANPALARIYGYENAEELINTVTDISSKLYVKPGRREEFVRLMRWHQVVTNFESQIYRKDGVIIWISENVRAVRDPQGNFRFYEGTVEDITERKEAEVRLQDSETLYHSLVENLPQFIFRKDLMERFTFGNQRFCQMMGSPLEELIGRTDFDYFAPELAEKYQSDDRQVMETGETLEMIETVQAPGKEAMYVNVVKSPLIDAEGKVTGLQGIFWDITPRVKAEMRERQAKEELARSRSELKQKNDELEKDLVMAREIQLSFFSQQYPVFPEGIAPQESAFQFYHRYIPAGTVSGDFFNILRISDQVAGMFVCDVMGHGVRSALVTAMLRAMLEELIPLAEKPGRLMAQVNQDLRAILRQTGAPMFTTGAFISIDRATGRLRYVNAGHPRPIIVHAADGRVDFLNPPPGAPQPALGLFDEVDYASVESPLAPGDIVLLYTDGLIECENAGGDWFSAEKLKQSVEKRVGQRLSEICDGIVSDVRQFCGEDAFDDDVCLVGAEMR